MNLPRDDFLAGCVCVWFIMSGASIFCELHNNSPGIGMGVAPPIDTVIMYTIGLIGFFVVWIVPLGAMVVNQSKKIMKGVSNN